MEINEIATKLLETMDEYMKQSCCTPYIASELEMFKINQKIQVLENHMRNIEKFEREIRPMIKKEEK